MNFFRKFSRTLRISHTFSKNDKNGNVREHNIEAFTRNHCWRGKAIIITICEGAFILEFVIRYANLIFSVQNYIVLYGLSDCTIFFHMISWQVRLLDKNIVEHKVCIWGFSYNFV
jgi:hypothetical protein